MRFYRHLERHTVTAGIKQNQRRHEMGLTFPFCSVAGPYVLGIPKAGSEQRMPWTASNVCASSCSTGNWALYRSLFCRNWAGLVPSLHYVLRVFCALEINSMLYSIWGLVNKSDSTKQSLNQGCLSHSTISLAKMLFSISCSHTFVSMASEHPHLLYIHLVTKQSLSI